MGVKKNSELERPPTSGYVCLSGHRVRAHPASSTAIKLPVGYLGLFTEA